MAEEIPGGYNNDLQPEQPQVHEEQTLEGQLTESYVHKGWTVGVVKGIKFSTQRDEMAKAIQAIPENAMVSVRVKKMIVAGGKEAFRPVSIEVLASPTESETEENGEQE